MKYQWIDNISDFENISSKWDQTLLDSGEDNPFLHSIFITAWWRYYATGNKLNIFVLWQNEKIIGGLPLYMDHRRKLQYPGGSSAGYTELLSNNIAPKVIWQNLLEALKLRNDWRVLELPRFRKLKRAEVPDKKGLLVNVYQSTERYLIDDFQNKLPKKLRYYLRRSENELSGKGELKLSALSSEAELINWFDKFVSLSRESFQHRQRHSNFEKEEYCSFVKELFLGFYQKGYLDVQALKLNNEIIALYFGYSLADNLNYLFPAFDIKLARFNPGHLLINELVKLAKARGNKLIDFYTGYRLYKKQWANKIEEVSLLEIRPPGAISRLNSASARWFRLLKAKLGNNRFLRKVFCR